MTGRRTVVYPPRRRVSLSDLVLLPIGVAIVLVAAGISLVVLGAVVSTAPIGRDPRTGDVDAALASILAAGAPSMRAVGIEPAIFGRRVIFVALRRRAGAEEARRAWCEVILPTGIGREYVRVYGGDGRWRPPRDCTDPASGAEFVGPYLED